MNTLGQQMALARGGSAPGARMALAQACEVEACDDARPSSAWASGLGGLGSVQGDGNSSTLTYNFGGAAAGIDYRFDPRFLVGLGVGYAHGTQWVNSSWATAGPTRSASRPTALHPWVRAGSTPMLWSGYAYSTTRCSGRSSSRACSAPPTGSTGANQFLAQIETGYARRLDDGDRSRRSRASRAQHHDAERLHRMGCQLAEPQRGAADDQLGSHGARRRPRQRIPLGSERSLGAQPAPGLAARVCRHRPADHGVLRRRAVNAFTVYGATPSATRR